MFKGRVLQMQTQVLNANRDFNQVDMVAQEYRAMDFDPISANSKIVVSATGTVHLHAEGPVDPHRGGAILIYGDDQPIAGIGFGLSDYPNGVSFPFHVEGEYDPPSADRVVFSLRVLPRPGTLLKLHFEHPDGLTGFGLFKATEIFTG